MSHNDLSDTVQAIRIRVVQGWQVAGVDQVVVFQACARVEQDDCLVGSEPAGIEQAAGGLPDGPSFWTG